MLDKIKAFFQTNIATSELGDNEHQLKLATAALMIEMMQQDDTAHQLEEQAVRRALQSKFGLTTDETGKLFELGYMEARNANDYYQFTSLINQHFSQQQKFKIIEYLWEIAYADGDLDRYEEYMVRRIAELIYVSHSEFIRAKHLVMNR
ncbi:MAG: TerB family tellurite resistance protein [Gammaproteobacteria bacterium]|nr:TerB family tellurite resistance protein [Gammaproteobacteria bacterium]